MKTYKPGAALSPQALKSFLKKAIQEHYDGLPVTRGIAFESDSDQRFWGENSEGVYCARILGNVPSFEDFESLRQEFLKLKSAFPESVDFIVFFPYDKDRGNEFCLSLEGVRELFADFKSVRFVRFLPISSFLDEPSILVSVVLSVEKSVSPIENPLPELSSVFEEGTGSERFLEGSLPGPAALTRQEIESFFEIGVEMKKAAYLKRLAG